VKLVLAALAGLLGPWLAAQSVAVTLDDGPNLAATAKFSALERNQALLKALAAHRLNAALFVTLGFGADRPEGLALARAWGEAGHLLGNHTVTHLDLNAGTTTLAAYQAELLACDATLRNLPGYRAWFRFTYLREGNTPEKRDGMRAFLASKAYRNAYVSLDTSDWRLDQRLKEVLARDPQADLNPLRKVYLEHVRQRAESYRALAQRLFGRDVPQVLLLHHNQLNALFLGDVLQQFQDLGWKIVPPEQAFADPVYGFQPERQTPGQSLLISIARSLGVKPDGYERLLDDGDFEIAELDRLGFK
jgi:peptidoglycan/xylan/chitin deacetylase (PgdA/CDA1 family)